MSCEILQLTNFCFYMTGNISLCLHSLIIRKMCIILKISFFIHTVFTLFSFDFLTTKIQMKSLRNYLCILIKVHSIKNVCVLSKSIFFIDTVINTVIDTVFDFLTTKIVMKSCRNCFYTLAP